MLYEVITDNCDDDLYWTDNSGSQTWGGTPANQQITITWTVTDDCDNTAQTTATYSIIDDEPPTITCPPSVTQTTTADNCYLNNVTIADPTYVV